MHELNQRQVYALLTAQFLALLGHLVHAPIGVIALWLVCALWRWHIARMRMRFPNRAVKLVLMLLAALFVWQSRGSVIGLEAGVVLLIAAFSLKIIEARTHRDAKVVIFLGFFVVLTAYLFESALWLALYSLVPIALLIAVWQGLYSPYMATNIRVSLKNAALFLLLAAPLMVVLFISFPRVGPLWAMPLPNDKRLSGLSEQMSPADVAELSQSSALAFRATFSSAIPVRQHLYWRALTLDHFDGRVWSHVPMSVQVDTVEGEETIDYSVLMQPSGKNWLFVLDRVMAVDQGRIMANYTVQRRRAVEQPMLYRARSYLEPSLESASVSPRYLQLPEHGEPKAREWAQSLKTEHQTPDEVVKALLRYFHEQPYYYSLKPGRLGEDSIDTFLFETRKGFCAHYAGAMAFVLRAAGIPSRVVAGYQGGEQINPNTLQVRQLDAHAWVEYWQNGKGWQRVDPTYAVAPERIEHGLEEAVSEEQSFLADSPFSPLRYKKFGPLNRLRLSWDQLNHQWQHWVLGFDRTQQQSLWSLLQRIWVYLLLVIMVLGLSMTVLMVNHATPRLSAADKAYRRFEALLARKGLVRALNEGPVDFAARAKVRFPNASNAIDALTHAYVAHRYARACSQAFTKELKALRDAL